MNWRVHDVYLGIFYTVILILKLSNTAMANSWVAPWPCWPRSVIPGTSLPLVILHVHTVWPSWLAYSSHASMQYARTMAHNVSQHHVHEAWLHYQPISKNWTCFKHCYANELMNTIYALQFPQFLFQEMSNECYWPGAWQSGTKFPKGY